MAYGTSSEVKNRLLIKSTDTTFDTAITAAIAEADKVVDMYLTPYEEDLPLSETPDMIGVVANDFAASIFKRRLNPDEVKLRGALQPDMINDVDGSGWFALGLRRLYDYIKIVYALAEEIGNSVYNPDHYMKLFKDGIITLKEARALMKDPTTVINAIVSNITKNINSIEESTEIKQITKTLNITKTQNAFGFVESDPDDRDAYKAQDDEEE